MFGTLHGSSLIDWLEQLVILVDKADQAHMS